MLSQSQISHLSAVQARYTDQLMRKPHVVGVAVGQAQRGGKITDEPALIVLVNHKLPFDQIDDEARIPNSLEGIRVDVQEIGDLLADISATSLDFSANTDVPPPA
jgi:hypothetical protein